jgi:hypothetical protein
MDEEVQGREEIINILLDQLNNLIQYQRASGAFGNVVNSELSVTRRKFLNVGVCIRCRYGRAFEITAVLINGGNGRGAGLELVVGTTYRYRFDRRGNVCRTELGIGQLESV